MLNRLSDLTARLGALPVRLLRPLARGKARIHGGLRPHQWFLALGAAVMFCVPHRYWNNLYGVLFAAAALVLYWWDCAAAEETPLDPAALGGGVWLFLLMCFLSAAWAVYPLAALRVALFYLAGFVLCYVAAASFSGAEARRRLIGCLYAALLLTAVYGLAAYAAGWDTYAVPVDGRILPRLASTMEHGINYGEFAAMLLPLGLVHAATARRGRVWKLALLAIPCVALALTYARTGWIALGLALLILLWALDRRLLIPATVLAAASAALLPAGLRERLLSMLQFNDTGSSGRFTLWRECFAMLREHWLAGVGLGPENFTAAYLPHRTGVLPFQPPHANMGYLEIFLSLGIVGFLAFLWFFFGIFPRLGRRLRSLPRGPERWETLALTASLAGAALANVPEHLWFYPRVLFVWCLLFGLALGRTNA